MMYRVLAVVTIIGLAFTGCGSVAGPNKEHFGYCEEDGTQAYFDAGGRSLAAPCKYVWRHLWDTTGDKKWLYMEKPAP